MQELPGPLKPLANYRQFMAYKLVPSQRKPGKMDKFPVNCATGEVVSAHDPKYWVDAQTACNTSSLWGTGFGVAFVFTDDDPFFFVDIDNCLINGAWTPLAVELCQRFAGAAIEVSQSGSGLHIIGRVTDAPEHACKNVPLGLECYTEERFVALTGTNATGSAETSHDVAFNTTVAQYFPITTTNAGSSAQWTAGHVEGSYPIPDDEVLIRKMLSKESANAAFGTKCPPSALWSRNIPELAKFFPDEDREFDESSADAALAQHLAFWTGNDCERIERLMRQSALTRRKWDKHKSYMFRTVTGACAKQKSWYSLGKPIELVANDVVIDVEQGAIVREGYQYLSITQTIELFKGCVYIAEMHRIFAPNGMLYKSEQFNAVYGGYVFSLDHTNEKTTRQAWEAFTQSLGATFPKAESFCFRPRFNPGHVIIEEGRRLVNTYVPITIRTEPGDVTPFLQHLAKLLPDQRDQQILLSFMAAVVQYKGHKFQWAPLLQGCEGNGKTLFTRCVAYAMGERYTHMPPASEISEKFNAWLFDKLFIGVEDIYVPDQRVEVLEVLKPMITGNRLARRAMQTDQTMHEICCNFMFNSNHRNAIKKTLNDRRFAVFFTAQQEAIDLVRDGMNGDYFPNLYHWLNNGGYARVAHYLQSYAIPDELNPTTKCQRAPDTTSTQEAVIASMGGVEQEILEAIEEGRTGFANGWVSSFALDKLIAVLRAERQIPRNKRRDLMRSLGYDWHPGLKDGRVNNVIAIDDGKPRLFIKNSHIHANLANHAEIARLYCVAQGDPLAVAAAANNYLTNPSK